MGKIKTVYKNIPLKRALAITIVGSLFVAFLGAMTILLATRPSYYALAAENPENSVLHWHDFFFHINCGNLCLCCNYRRIVYFL